MSNELGTHAMMRFEDSRVVAGDPVAMRRAAVGVLRVGRPFRLLAFRLADTHLHAVLVEPGARAREFARRVEISLQRRLSPGVAFARVHTKRIEDQAHLQNAFWYVLKQEQRHGTSLDPLFDGSNLPDLLGWRTIGAWTNEHVERHLPRIKPKSLREILPVRAAGGAGPLDFGLLGEAAAAAAGLATVRSRCPAARAARVAAIHAFPDLKRAELARRLGVTERAITRLRTGEADEDLVVAVRRQVAVRSAFAALQRAAPPADRPPID